MATILCQKKVLMLGLYGLKMMTEIKKDVFVFTVFLGLDHQFFYKGPQHLFETVVFGGKLDGEIERYSTWEEAEKGHKRWAEKVKGIS